MQKNGSQLKLIESHFVIMIFNKSSIHTTANIDDLTRYIRGHIGG